MLSIFLLLPTVAAFAPFLSIHKARSPLVANKHSHFAGLERISDEVANIPIPFVECNGSKFIECYPDSKALLDGIEYTIGVPCDNAVALCYFDDEGNLLPVELDDEMMDDVFPIAESIVTEEFGEELSLERTPQTLTLVGELEDEEEEEEDSEEDEEELEDGDEEVEILLSFEHRDTEFNLVRLLDPVFLVGKAFPGDSSKRSLLTKAESDAVMPKLEEMFLDFEHERE